MKLLPLVCLFSLIRTGAAFSPAVLRPNAGTATTLALAPSDAETLRESAQKLRDEANALESNMDRKPKAVADAAVVYTSLKESMWTLTYRFASDPPSDEDDRAVSNYSGKLTVKLLPDGYTELISHEPSGGADARLDVLKVWGWDKEFSNEDEKDYVLFSTNIRAPASDVAMANEELRFYWQARVDYDSTNRAISLADGTVTVKKDVEPPGGFWGIFNGGGILAQFRYVGNFAAKIAS